MKKFHVIVCFTALLGLFSMAGCKKETTANSSLPPGPSLPPLASNSAPKANAGVDILVILPVNSCVLYGSTSGSNIKSYAWKKISGPSTYILESPDSLGTKVSNLEKGIYEIELAVTDKTGLTDKDTTTITVGEISSNPREIVFKDLSWGHEGLFGTLLWGTIVGVRNIYTYVPVGNVFKVYIQRDGSPDWVEVAHPPLQNALYSLVFMNGHLGVYSDFDETDTPNLKIVY